jgi:hypothetical protein
MPRLAPLKGHDHFPISAEPTVGRSHFKSAETLTTRKVKQGGPAIEG